MVFTKETAHLRPAFFRKARLVFPLCFVAGATLEYVFCKYGGYNALIRSEAKTRFMSKHDEDLYWLDRRERERRGLVYQYSQGALEHTNPAMAASTGPVLRPVDHSDPTGFSEAEKQANKPRQQQQQME